MNKLLAIIVALFAAGPASAAEPRELSPIELADAEHLTWGSGLLTASAGGKFLTVWTGGFGDNYHIFGRVSDKEGSPSGDRARAVVRNAYGTASALVATDSVYSLFWSEFGGRQHLTEISTDGVPLSTVALPPGVAVEDAAWLDGRYLVVSSSGFLLDERGQIITEVTALRGITPYENVQVLTADGYFFVVIVKSRRVSVAKISADGELVAGPVEIRVSSEPILRMHAASNGSALLLVTSGRSGVRIASVSSDLLVMSSEPVLLESGVLGTGENVVWTGTNYILFVLVSDGTGNPRAYVISPDGTATSSARVEDVPKFMVSVASNGLVVLRTGRQLNSSAVVSSALRTPALETIGTSTLSILPVVQSPPALATDGRDVLAVWRERSALHAALVDSNGSPLSVPIEVTLGVSNFAVASNGHDYLVTWTDHRGVSMTRVTRAGVLEDSGPTLVRDTTNASDIGAIWTGSDYLLVWSERGQLVSARIDAEGTAHVQQHSLSLPETAFFISGLRLATDGQMVVVAFVSSRRGPCLGLCSPIRFAAAARLSADGRALHHGIIERPITIDDISAGGIGLNMVAHVSVAASGNRFLMVHGTSDGGVLATPLFPHGATFESGTSTTLFEWINEVSAEVTPAPDGFDVVMVYRSGVWSTCSVILATEGAPRSVVREAFLGLKRVDPDGQPLAPLRGQRLHDGLPASLGRFSNGVVMSPLIPLSQAIPGSESPRAVVYRADEFPLLPLPPRAPGVSARISTDGRAILDIDTDSDELGFVMQHVWGDRWSVGGELPPGTRSLKHCSSTPMEYRIRAWNSGGVSPWQHVTIPQHRRRSVGR